MKAAVLHEFGNPLIMEEVVRPNPEHDEVLIEVKACGVCHSDLHVAHGDWPQFANIVKKPLILRREISGRVVERGSSVRDLQVMWGFPGFIGVAANANYAARAMRICARSRM
jgi:propanol-preferring alcohol dehydrogenase